MSDEEELVYVKRARTIHYGSLEDNERLRQETGDGGDRMDTAPSTGGDPTADYYKLEEEM